MSRKYMLGKVFISHSWKDKAFVRKLTKALWEEGYQVWLDEKELVPGDGLATRLSDALSQSKVVIVVVTPNSIDSRWLRFELNKATERMVQGNCRIIPVLKGRVEAPSELKGLIYADFRRSFKKGLEAVLAALSKEADAAVIGSWKELECLVEETFDHHGFADVSSAYDSFDYDYVDIDGLKDFAYSSDGDDATIIYEVVHDYGSRKEPLNQQWWHEFVESRERYGATFHLIVTERPITFVDMKLSKSAEAVWKYVGVQWKYPLIIVIADLSQAKDANEKFTVLKGARATLIEVGKSLRQYQDATVGP